MSKFCTVFIVIWASSLVCCAAQAQEDDPNCALQPQNKKVKKMYGKVLDPSTPEKERIALLKESVQIDPECAVCYFDLASIAYAYARETGSSYDRAREYFSRVSDICPDFHAEVYFGLAVMAKDESDNDIAVKYLKQYVAFKSDDAPRYGGRYDEKRKWAQNQIEELIFFKDYYNNKVPFDPQPLANVSSKLDEYLPMISPDNELMFYTRKIKANSYDQIAGDDRWLEQLTSSKRPMPEGTFNAGEHMGEPFNDPQFTNLGGVTISVDNHEMIICGCKKEEVYEQVYTNCDLYSSKFQLMKNPYTGKEEYRWGPMKNLGPMVNTNDGWEAAPTLSGDGQTLYFAARRAGTKDIDIYQSKRNSKGKWGIATPVEGLNSNGDDKVPFMHSDSKTMYFVSGPNPDQQRNNPEYVYNRKGVGGFDIYYARQQEDGSWSKPKLMAYPINTESDEVGIIVSTDGHIAYFASNRSNSKGGQDVFSFNLYEEARPEKVVLIKGEVVDEAGNGDTTAVVEIAKKGSDEKATVKVNENGSYAAIVTVKKDEEILVKAKKQGAFLQTQLIKSKDVAQTYVKGSDFKVEPIKVGKAFTVEDILFATASFNLEEDSYFVLDQFVEFLQENPGIRVEIQGHTDNEGGIAKNQVLSDNRARVVKEYLVSKGIENSRLTYKGYGESMPKVPNTTPENKAKNRRTDFKILSL